MTEIPGRLDVAARAIAVELGHCDPGEWDRGECNTQDRELAYRVAAAALPEPLTQPPPNPRVLEALSAVGYGIDVLEGRVDDPFRRTPEERALMQLRNALGSLTMAVEQPYAPNLAYLVACLLDGLWKVTLCWGNHRPGIIDAMYEQMANPHVGDLVLETSSLYRRPWAYEGLGVLRRIEQTRGGDVMHVQPLVNPANVCRWENSSFVAAPTEMRAGHQPVTMTRESLTDALGLAGIDVKEPPDA